MVWGDGTAFRDGYYAYRDALKVEFKLRGPEMYQLYVKDVSLDDARIILDKRGCRLVKRRYPVIDRNEVDRRIREAIRSTLQECLDKNRFTPDDLAYVRRLIDMTATAV